MGNVQKKGKLYLIPNRLGDLPPLEVLPLSIRKVINEIDHYIVENEKVARHFIKKIVPSKSQPNLEFKLLNKFTSDLEIPSFLEACEQGINMGLLSDAGCPGVADPGAQVVALAHQNNIQVVPLVGPSSILLALMSSGLNGQSFTFHGYLPIDNQERKHLVKKIEKTSLEQNQAQIFIETPYRNNKLLISLISTLQASTRICVAVDLTLSTEFIKTQTAAEWKKTSIDLHKRPAIFLIQG
ncbi:SAM-dependent methyltransferase [Psychroflexus sediminis]|uniref:16S rRNA (Cytidine1402-2'-O)-methyltransferase n=1 Tax=Psychroflexus sediminis TaxID=470826 RepID=A0A1G7VRA1_9FLAO|nr:SAM-dependent methyltransferase [Psychroflexus sediminis]SDG62121.1 16S rRNA (cytidine1402-2'-O)-methyltransferase [Psychroflexus sediminis]